MDKEVAGMCAAAKGRTCINQGAVGLRTWSPRCQSQLDRSLLEWESDKQESLQVPPEMRRESRAVLLDAGEGSTNPAC